MKYKYYLTEELILCNKIIRTDLILCNFSLAILEEKSDDFAQ